MIQIYIKDRYKKNCHTLEVACDVENGWIFIPFSTAGVRGYSSFWLRGNIDSNGTASVLFPSSLTAVSTDLECISSTK